MVLPSGKKTRIARIETQDGELESAAPPMSVAILLEDEIDISRGDMICRPHNQPTVATELDAMMCWMADAPLREGGRYQLKHTTRTVKAMVDDLRYRIDVNSLHRDQNAAELGLNEIGRVRLKTSGPLLLDPYDLSRTTGGFILIDETTHGHRWRRHGHPGRPRAAADVQRRHFRGCGRVESELMAQRGSGSDAGPNACPFVALELDRDRRSERPDYRHRCYAEQVPAPRTVAHQERFCLSPNFSGCPIFQDWAVRAAARPVALPQGYEDQRSTPDPRISAGAGAAAAAAGFSAAEAAPDPSDFLPEPGQPTDPAGDQVWPDSMATDLPANAAAAASVEPPSQQQLSAFDSPQPTFATEPEPEPEAQYVDDWQRAASDTPRMDPGPAHDINDAADDEREAAPVPAFLVGRSSRPRPSASPESRAAREDVVPSWEISDRFGAQSGGEPKGDGLFGRLLTMVVVVIILGLGVAAVVLVPGLMAGSPQGTNRPSPNVSSGVPTPRVSSVAVEPTAAVPTVAPATVGPTTVATAAPSPKLYRIKSRRHAGQDRPQERHHGR